MSKSSPRRGQARLILVSVCALAIVGLVGAVVRQSAVVNSTASDLVSLEAGGATALHPMLTLLGDLVEAQSDAVRGDPVDTAAITKALDKISGLDPTYGRALRTDEALTDLASKIRSTLALPLTGREAYDSYSGLVTLAQALMRHTADTSHLIHDPELDSFFVMDAAITRLPDAMVFAGRAADLVSLAGGVSLTGEDAVRAAVARFGVSSSAEQVSAGLNQSVDVTTRSALGTNIADRLDTFMAAAGAFAPPTMLSQLSGAVTDAATLATNARRVYAAALPLAHLLLSELQALLEQRQLDLASQWRFTATASAIAALVALVLAWVLLAGGRGRGSHAERRDDDTPVTPLTDAQDLLDQPRGDDELVHIGRSARPRPRGHGDAG